MVSRTRRASWPCVAEFAAAGSWPGCRFAASPAPFLTALLFLGRMHHADCAHVAGGAEPHDGKARNWRLEGGIDHAAPAHRPDLEATGNDDGDCSHMGMDDNLDVPVIELGLAQINRHGAHTYVDLGETAHLPAALEANLAHRGRDLQRLLTPPRVRSEFDGGRQGANHRGEVSLGMGPEQSIEGFLKAVEIHRAAGQESLQEVDPALLEVLRDGGFGLGWEPVVVHASRLSPDARTDIRAGPAPGPGAHLQFVGRVTRHGQAGLNTRQRNLRHLFTWLEEAYGHQHPHTSSLHRYAPVKKRPSTLAQEFVRDLLEVTGGGRARGFEDVRDHAMIRVLTEGVRRMELIQLDMSEYMEKHTVSRLFGTLSLLFLELSDHYVNAVQLHVRAADVLVRCGIHREDLR